MKLSKTPLSKISNQDKVQKGFTEAPLKITQYLVLVMVSPAAAHSIPTVCLSV
jgi:hypothetical protein